MPIRLSNEKKVLLYLYEHLREQNELDPKKHLPKELTVEVMMDKTGMPHPVIYRALGELGKKELVEQQKHFISETGRRRAFHLLTYQGKVDGKQLADETDMTKVIVKRGDRTENMLLKELVDLSAKMGENVDRTGILKAMDKQGLVELKDILVPVKYVDHSDVRPAIRNFFGRESELQVLEEFLGSDTRVLAVRGLAGVGKTILVAKALEDHTTDVFWYRFTQFSSLRGFISRLGDFLNSLDMTRLRNHLESPNLDMEGVMFILEEDLRGSNVILICDDVQKCSEDIMEFFRALKDILSDSRMIVMGREIPSFYDRSDVKINRTVQELVVLGLDRESGIQLLRERGITSSVEDLFEVTKGHPLMLELINEGTNVEAEEYFREEIFKKLEPDERKVLELASVIRYPFPAAAVIDYADYDTLDSLSDKSLMQRTGDLYDLHDLIREFFYNRLNENQRTAYHLGVSNYYLEQGGDAALIEGAYHLLRAGDAPSAGRIAVEHGESMMRRGLVNEYGTLLDAVEEAGGLEEDPVLLLHRGTIQELTGDLDGSIDNYKHAHQIGMEADNRVLTAQCHLKIGGVYEKKSQWDKALEESKFGLSISEEAGDAEGMLRGHYAVGRQYWWNGKMDEALKYLEKALKMATGSGDQPFMAKAYLDMGNVHNSRGDYERAEQLYSKSIEISEQMGNRYELGRGYNSLSVLFHNKGDIDTALDYCEKMIELSSHAGWIRGMLYGLANASEMYAETGNEEKILEYNERALDLATKLGEKTIIGGVYNNYGRFYALKEDWDSAEEYFNRAVAIGEEINSKYTLAQFYHDFADMFKKKGDSERARESYAKALKLFKEIKNEKKAKKIEAELDQLK